MDSFAESNNQHLLETVQNVLGVEVKHVDIKSERGVIYFDWDANDKGTQRLTRWRVTDTWDVSVQFPYEHGFGWCSTSLLFHKLLRKHGEIEGAKQRLFEEHPHLKDHTPKDADLGFLIHCSLYKKLDKGS